MKRKENIEQEILKLTRKKGDIEGTIEVKVKTLKELEEKAKTIGVEKLQSDLKALVTEKEQLKRLLDGKNKEIDAIKGEFDKKLAKKNEQFASLQIDYDVVKEKLNEKREFSKIEPLRSHQQVVLNDAPKIVERTAPLSSEKVTREVTERTEKVTKEIIEKPVAQTEINNDLEEAKTLRCSEQNREVNIDVECGHCSKILECSDYAVANEKIRELS